MSTEQNAASEHFIVMPEPQRYALVLRWTADPADWDTSPEAVLGALAAGAEASGIHVQTVGSVLTGDSLTALDALLDGTPGVSS